MLIRKLWFLKKALKQQWMKPEELKKLQEKKLRAIIRHAYKNIPFYKKKWKKIGIKPDDIKTVEDLRKLPIITKSEVRRNKSKIIALNLMKFYRIGNYISLRTSGTTTRCFTALFDEEAYDYVDAMLIRAWLEHGLKARDKMAYFWNEPIERKFYEHFGLFKKRYISLTKTSESEMIKILEDLKPDVILCFANTLELLAKIVINENIEKINPKFIISTGELLTRNSRRLIESAFSSEVFDQYSVSEFGQIGWECKMHEGLHIDVDNLVVEFVKDEENVNFGEEGEIVVTTLSNYFFPLIRYNLEDIGTPLEYRCSCGRGLDMMKIKGRKRDIIKFKRKIFSYEIFDILAKYKEIFNFKISVRKRNKIKVDIVPFKDKIKLEASKRIEEEIKDLVGNEAIVEINIASHIPKSDGGKIIRYMSHANFA